jgi:hypothetical protein
VSDPKNAENVGQREEGDDVEAHSYRAAAANAESYRNVGNAENAESYASEEPPDVEGHAFNVENVENVE